MHGQVAWALARGQPPSEQLIDQLRYLRQLGVPFSKAELGAGSGHRIRYGFDHLIELGVAVFGLERGMRPREVAKIWSTIEPSFAAVIATPWPCCRKVPSRPNG